MTESEPTLIRVFDGVAMRERQVPAVAVRGVWALHPKLVKDGAFHATDFSMTHVPTGSTVAKSIPTRERGMKLLAALPELWAQHAGFGPAGVAAVRNRKDIDEVGRVIATWSATT